MERNQWLIDLYEDESLWVDENTICLPPIIKDEYEKIYIFCSRARYLYGSLH